MKTRVTLATTALILMSLSVSAADEKDAATTAVVKADASKSEKPKQDPQETNAQNDNAAKAEFKPSYSVAGMLQIHGRVFDHQTGPGPVTADTILLRRGELRVTGTITPRINGWIMIDPAKQLSANANGVTQSTNILQEIAIAYQLAPKLFVDLGQYKIPVGYEGDLVSSGQLQNVERALIYQARDSIGGGQGDIRESGVRLRGQFGSFDYQIGAFNGLGERQNTTAVADARALLGRLVYNVPSIKGLRLGISGARAAQASTLQRHLSNAFVVYKEGRATIQTEYLTGKNKFQLGGYYGHFGWAFTPHLEGTLRHDTFDFNRNSHADTRVRDIIIGTNYYIKGNNAKIQANLIRRNGGDALLANNGFWANALTFSKSNTQLRLNFQVLF